MNMNSIIARYKKTALLVTLVAAVSMSSVLSAGCSACAAAAAIRQSIKDAQAAALAGGKKAIESELDEVDWQAIDEAADRAAREELVDPCNPFFSCTACEDDKCSLNCKLQALYNCCVSTNKDVRHQAHEARKCCKRLRHEINEVEDQVEGCCSVLEELMVSQIDQSAECCSVIDSRLGDPATQIPSFQDCYIDVLNYVNSNNDDVITWLKRLYVLMYQVFSCNCCAA